jgi:NAD(P)-dependent dehydrogenase (short-subunit alcohol dehydrogenase family)
MSKTILITGAAKRLGQFLAISFAKMGYNIALHYNSSKEEAIKNQEKIKHIGTKCQIFAANLQEIDNCQKLIKDVENYFGKIDILINNSSVFIEGDFFETTEEIFNENFNVNYKSIFFLSQSFAKNNSGNIINLIDTYITRRSKRFFTYLNSKKYLEILTKDMALELAPKIRVNAIAPGAFLPAYEFAEDYISTRSKKAPLNHYVTMEDILNSMDFILKSPFLTGQIIYIDGGEHLMTL